MIVRCCRLFAALLVLVGPGCQLLPGNPSRVVAERFVQALRGEADTKVDAYLAADAEVFLQGAQTPISPARFQEYIDVLRRGRQEFEAASRVFVTPTGAGWLLRIGPTTDNPSVNPPGPAIPAQLWMETLIREDRITRVWLHFTVEALPRLAVSPETYRTVAASRGLPVPDGWSEGTPALLAAAERTDRLVDGDSAAGSQLMLVVVVVIVGGLVARVGFFAARLRVHQRPRPTGRRSSGVLLENLRKAHSVANARP